MNSSTKCSQQTSPKTTWKEPRSNSTQTLNDVEENLELTLREQALLKRWDNEHLAYADVDLHY